MDKETCRKRKKLRKRRRLKRIVIAYLLRVLVVLVPLMMIILMVCGCLYIYEKWGKACLFPLVHKAYAPQVL